MIAEPLEFPTRDESHQVEEDGLVEVQRAVVRQLTWIFRPQPIRDYGVDAHLEVVSDDDHVTGKNIGAQIKSGLSWFSKPAPGGWTFSENTFKHYNYWLGHSLPIVLILHHPTREKLYWQVVDQDTAKITGKGFKVIVPEANVLDASAKSALEDIARRLGPAAVAVYDRSLNVLPASTVRALQAVEQVDRMGAARVAQILAEGRAQPRFAVQQVVAAAPSWLVGSAASAELWAATAAYANAHGEHDLAVDAFDLSARAGGPRAPRRGALAGLSLITAGRREEARAYLDEAKAGGAILLADVGLAALTVPADHAGQAEVPQSIKAATDAEIDAEPTVLNFLAEQRMRAGDVDGAIDFVRRAVQGPGERNSEMRLRLAEMLRRRIQEHAGFGGSDSAEARLHARAACDEFRRWSGPSENALGELLDLEILDGDLATVVELALPAAADGAASDREAAAPQIARRGATAALMSGRDDALALFRQVLDGDPYVAQLAAQELELRGGELEQRQQAWRHALQISDDDRGRAACILRLAELGVWPISEADDLLARSITPEWTYRLAEAVARAATGDPDGAIPVVRVMAQERVLAAVHLIMLVDRHQGGAASAQEWLRQYARWQDASLADVLPEALWTADDDNTSSLVADLLGDPRLSGDTRARLRRQLVHHLRGRRVWDRVIRVCRAGLQERPDGYLAWSLVQALHATLDVAAARHALGQHCPAPETEQQARLWAQLHVGVDLTDQDAEAAADLAERFPDVSTLAEALTALLRREQHRRRRDGALAWPQPLLDRIEALSATVYAGADPDAIAEATVAQGLGQIGYQRLEDLRLQVQQGREPLAALASLARSPYGKMLLLRTAGMTVATDPEPGIAAVGVAIARQAIDERTVVVDQSALYLQELLGGDGDLLRMRFAELHVPASAADDAIRTRDSIWVTTGTNVVFGIHNGQLRREEIPAARRASLRAHATNLEQVTTRMTRHDVASPSHGPAHDAVDLAGRLGIALYADDVALRQIARARGVATFGTIDLITAAGYPSDQADTMIRRLAAEYVVDLPLGADDLTHLESNGEWHGAGRLNISRSQWWKRADAHGISAWRSAALSAARVSGDNLVLVTKYALHGALQDCPAAQRTQRYQQIVVAALDAVHEGGLSAPDNYLARLTTATIGDVSPAPRFVYHALLAALRERGVDDPHAAAAAMLPESEGDPATWR